MKMHTFSIVMVKYNHGGKQWLKAKKGRNLNTLVKYFSNYQAEYLKVFEFNNRKKQVGKLYYWHSYKTGSSGTYN